MGTTEKIKVSNVFRAKVMAQLLRSICLSPDALTFSVIDDTNGRVCMHSGCLQVSGVLPCARFISAMRYYGVSESEIRFKLVDCLEGLIEMKFIVDMYGETDIAEMTDLKLEECEDECDEQDADCPDCGYCVRFDVYE